MTQVRVEADASILSISFRNAQRGVQRGAAEQLPLGYHEVDLPRVADVDVRVTSGDTTMVPRRAVPEPLRLNGRSIALHLFLNGGDIVIDRPQVRYQCSPNLFVLSGGNISLHYQAH